MTLKAKMLQLMSHEPPQKNLDKNSLLPNSLEHSDVPKHVHNNTPLPNPIKQLSVMTSPW